MRAKTRPETYLFKSCSSSPRMAPSFAVLKSARAAGVFAGDGDRQEGKEDGSFRGMHSPIQAMLCFRCAAALSLLSRLSSTRLIVSGSSRTE